MILSPDTYIKNDIEPKTNRGQGNSILKGWSIMHQNTTVNFQPQTTMASNGSDKTFPYKYKGSR